MLECVGQMILAANDVADAKVGIVGAGSQMISRRAIAAQQGEILNIRRRFRLFPVNAVREPDILDNVAWHAVAEHKRLTRGGTTVALLMRQLSHTGMEQPRGA